MGGFLKYANETSLGAVTEMIPSLTQESEVEGFYRQRGDLMLLLLLF
jgi:hypothetical protein